MMAEPRSEFQQTQRAVKSASDDHTQVTSGFKVRTKVWIESDGEVVISDFLAQLLEAVAEEGSVAAAAETLDLPYRTAWKKLREMESAADLTFIESTSGGRDGGSTRLSSDAIAMITALRRISAPLASFAQARFDIERSILPLQNPGFTS